MLNSLTTKARSIYQKLSRNLSGKDMDLVVDLIEAIKYPHEGPPSKKFKFEEIKVNDFLKMLDQGKVIEKGLGYYAQECYGDQAYHIPFGTWSDKKEILHASKEEGDSYSINLSRGSFPWCRKELIVDRFRFYKFNK